MTALPAARGPLSGLRVLDLSRVLAGPTATQMLGDLGADVVKVERPQRGDDARAFGPPFVAAHAPEDDTSAYFVAANRNKRSIAVDFATPDGAARVAELAARADVFVENLKTGALERHGLGYAELARINPRIIYCSITGFGQTGPRAHEPGYDLLAQAMGGVMSLTGPRDGQPYKAGVGIADLVCGYHAVIAILAALEYRTRTGRGQHIDLSLYDTQLAMLANVAVDAFATGAAPERQGNGHPHIVPYGVFETADGHLALTIGNDAQFCRFAALSGDDSLATDPRFATNAVRITHRELTDLRVTERLKQQPTRHWCEVFAAAGIPCGPVRSVHEAFADPQAIERGMRVRLPASYLQGGAIDVVGSPFHFSESEVGYRLPPPRLGEHEHEVERDWLAEHSRAGLRDPEHRRNTVLSMVTPKGKEALPAPEQGPRHVHGTSPALHHRRVRRFRSTRSGPPRSRVS